MNSQKNIQDELGSLGSTLPFNNNPTYLVPAGYFEELAAIVLARAKNGDSSVQAELNGLSPLLARIPKSTPYSVPFDYFKENARSIPDVAPEPQLSVLDGFDKKMPYQVPPYYFEGLAEQIVTKVVPSKARVVPLFARGWVRMAAAAVIGGAFFLGGYQYLNTKPQQAIVANRPDTVETQVATRAPAIEQEIKKVSTKDLEQFIRNAPIGIKEITGKTAAEKNNVKVLLKDVSDAEMEAFLSAIPASDDELIITD